MYSLNRTKNTNTWGLYLIYNKSLKYNITSEQFKCRRCCCFLVVLLNKNTSNWMCEIHAHCQKITV